MPDKIPYVDEETLSRAVAWEKKFRAVPGAIFVSVTPTPIVGGRSEYFEVRLGLDRKFEERTGFALIHHVLREELAAGVRFSWAVYRGSSCVT